MRKRLELNFDSTFGLIVGATVGVFLLCLSHYTHYIFVHLEKIFSYGYRITDLWRFPDFEHYYGSAWLFFNSSRIYGESLRFLQPQGFVFFEEIPSATNPPLLVLLLSFLAKLRPQTGWVILQLASVVSSVLAIVLVVRNFAHNENRRIKLTIFVLALAGFWFIQHLLFCQIQSVLFLLVMLSRSALRKSNKTLGGALIGLAISLKLFLWPLAFFLLLTGRYRAIISAATVIFGTLFLTQSFDSLSYVDFFEHAAPIINEWGRDSVLNLSLFGALSKFYRYCCFASSADRAGLIDSILYLLGSFVFPVAVTVFVYFRYKRGLLAEDTMFASVLVISILSSPVCWPHYLCFAIPLFSVIGLQRMIPRSVVIALWLAAPWQTVYATTSNTDLLSIYSIAPTLIMLLILFRAVTYSFHRTKLSQVKCA